MDPCRTWDSGFGTSRVAWLRDTAPPRAEPHQQCAVLSPGRYPPSCRCPRASLLATSSLLLRVHFSVTPRATGEKGRVQLPTCSTSGLSLSALASPLHSLLPSVQVTNHQNLGEPGDAMGQWVSGDPAGFVVSTGHQKEGHAWDQNPKRVLMGPPGGLCHRQEACLLTPSCDPRQTLTPQKEGFRGAPSA